MKARAAARIAILGAGVAGASAARCLVDAGHRVVVHDKGRQPGGRAATRARAGDHFDHGAQYFTARDRLFVQQVESWAQAGVVAEWWPRLVAIAADGGRSTPSPERRWVGVPGMNRLAASLLDGIDVRRGSRVIAAELRDQRWSLALADGSVDGPFEALLCTLPAPQAVQLFPQGPLARLAGEVVFAPCWALMLEFSDSLETGFDAAFVNRGPLSWIARDSSKPGRPRAERWVVHAGPDFSRAHMEGAAEAVAIELTKAFFDAVGSAPTAPSRSAAHRWRFALAQPPLQRRALADARMRLVIGGDWCNGSRIEGAWLSGQAMARHAIDWMPARS